MTDIEAALFIGLALQHAIFDADKITIPKGRVESIKMNIILSLCHVRMLESECEALSDTASLGPPLPSINQRRLSLKFISLLPKLSDARLAMPRYEARPTKSAPLKTTDDEMRLS